MGENCKLTIKGLSWKQIVTIIGIVAAALGGTGYSAMTADGASTEATKAKTEAVETQTVVREHTRRLDKHDIEIQITRDRLADIDRKLAEIIGYLKATTSRGLDK